MSVSDLDTFIQTKCHHVKQVAYYLGIRMPLILHVQSTYSLSPATYLLTFFCPKLAKSSFLCSTALSQSPTKISSLIPFCFPSLLPTACVTSSSATFSYPITRLILSPNSSIPYYTSSTSFHFALHYSSCTGGAGVYQ